MKGQFQCKPVYGSGSERRNHDRLCCGNSIVARIPLNIAHIEVATIYLPKFSIKLGTDFLVPSIS
jgi:hypothetical protein